MKLGLFLMPMHPPSTPHADAYDVDLQTLVRADELGYDEAIAVAGLSAYSETLVLAGERGWIPMSINFRTRTSAAWSCWRKKWCPSSPTSPPRPVDL
jgi:hypothetical protein